MEFGEEENVTSWLRGRRNCIFGECWRKWSDLGRCVQVTVDIWGRLVGSDA